MAKGRKKDPQKKLIVGVGSALVDILLLENEEFLTSTGAKKGGMTHIEDNTVIDALLSKSKAKQSVVPGGSACNTLLGVGRLGGPARFIGKRGNDYLGNLFEASLEKHNVQPILFSSNSPTGRVLSVITPDSQRTMFTFLGAASEMKPEEILAEQFKDAALVHIEGYLLFNPTLLFAALKAARLCGALISLDLASFTVVEASKAILDDIVNEYVDILIANEDEARAFTGLADEEKALESLAKAADVAVLKIGKRGSLVSHFGKKYTVDRMGSGAAIDTTGAGDLWAAGFLYGFVNDYPIEDCGKLASACGYEVCQVIGASIPDSGWERIKNYKTIKE
jgi:sugar/nucleoside kinase (ribokinase family)